MLRLLDIEFHKFKHSKSSKVLTIIYLIVIVLLLTAGAWPIPLNGQTYSLSDIGVFNFPFVWHLSTYMVSFLKFLIAIVIVSLTASEYSNRTLKQNLIDGLSKKELILSKFYLVFSMAIAATVILIIAVMILGLLYSDYTEPSIIFRDLQYIGGFFISHLTFFSMCLFAGILVKRSAFALGLIGIWGIFEFAIFITFQFVDSSFNLNAWEYLRDILPLNSISNLVAEPFTKVTMVQAAMKQISPTEYEMNYNVRWINLFICLGWTSLFTYWSYALLKRRDL